MGKDLKHRSCWDSYFVAMPFNKGLLYKISFLERVPVGNLYLPWPQASPGFQQRGGRSASALDSDRVPWRSVGYTLRNDGKSWSLFFGSGELERVLGWLAL